MNIFISLLRGIFGSPVSVEPSTVQPSVLSVKKSDRSASSQESARSGTIIPNSGGGLIDYHADTPAPLQTGSVGTNQKDETFEIRTSPQASMSADDTSVDEPKSIEEWKEFLENESSDDPKYSEAFKSVFDWSTSLEDFLWLYQTVGKDSPHARSIVDKVEARTTDTFGDLQSEYSNATELTPMTRTILKKALALASEPSHYVSLTQDSDSADDEDKKLVRKTIEELSWPKDKWETMINEASDANDCNDLVDLAQIRVVAFCESSAEIIEFFIKYVEEWSTEDKVLNAIYEKLFQLAPRPELKSLAKLAGKFEEGECLQEAIEEFLKK